MLYFISAPNIPHPVTELLRCAPPSGKNTSPTYFLHRAPDWRNCDGPEMHRLELNLIETYRLRCETEHICIWCKLGISVNSEYPRFFCL